MKDLDDRELADAMKQVRGSWPAWLLLVLTLGVAGYGGWEMHRRSETSDKIISEVDARIAEKAAQMAVLDQAKKELDWRLERLERENRDLLPVKMREEEEKKRRALDKVRLEHLKTRIREKLPKEVAGGLVQLEVGDTLAVQVAEKALFDAAEPNVSATGQQLLLAIGGVLTATTGIALEIGGHSDESPTAWETSASKAGAIAHFLAEKAHFAAAKMTAIGYGATRPIGKGAAQNRRFELRTQIEPPKN